MSCGMQVTAKGGGNDPSADERLRLHLVLQRLYNELTKAGGVVALNPLPIFEVAWRKYGDY